MTARSKLDGKEIYWCNADNCWKYKNTKTPIEKIYHLCHFEHGEDINVVTELSREQLAIIDVIAGGNAVRGIDPDHPMEIRMVSKETARECNIQGVMFGDNISRENAERVVDGLEPIDEE